jgi:hypothetical protein
MKYTAFLPYIAATSCLTLTTTARHGPLLREYLTDQSPLATPPDVVAMPPPGTDNPDSKFSTGIMLSDVLGKAQEIAIFSSLTRDIDSVADRIDDSSKNATILAPSNSVMRGLKRKPWEDPKDYDTFGQNAYSGSEGEDRAHRNLRRFVESHIVPESPWKEGEKVKSLAGAEIWFESKDGKKTVSSLVLV